MKPYDGIRPCLAAKVVALQGSLPGRHTVPMIERGRPFEPSEIVVAARWMYRNRKSMAALDPKVLL